MADVMTEARADRLGGEGHRAPWWTGYLFLLPLRRLWESPRRVCGPWVRPGDTIFELGPAMGWFTPELARLAGPAGRVVCSEVQPRMLDGLRRRLRRAGLLERVELRLCASDDPRIDDLRGAVDFALLHNVIHEVDRPAHVLETTAAALRPGGRLYLSEPQGHVAPDDFAWEASVLSADGLVELARPRVRRQMTVVLERPEAA